MIKRMAIALLLVSGLAQGADPVLHTDLPLSYLEQAPSVTLDKPLVIFLHGYGSNENDLFQLRDQLPEGYTYLSVRAPQTLEEGSYQWFHKQGDGPYDGVTADLASSRQVLHDFIAKAIAKYHTKASKVVLVGFSQGAIMSYELGLREPQSVRGIAVLSGKILPVLQGELKPNPALESLSIFIGHGMDDDRLPFTDASEAQRILHELGLTPDFHAYADLGHSISKTEIEDLNAWLGDVLAP
ncbi:phospholipase/carboxylesterase [Pseudomonas sp. M47T1]|uniref:alpha/beta hydrolase n=1 Tax=unclassified Pseudomonas TaxID=196821 RepID=UPI0002608AA9|nr:alpha/beta fold hydrolase [Pseudomonas sp. M47T1]EIK96301.1 phospholipase/carboxylesterase [Pseudomonas sp. M47T1]